MLSSSLRTITASYLCLCSYQSRRILTQKFSNMHSLADNRIDPVSATRTFCALIACGLMARRYPLSGSTCREDEVEDTGEDDHQDDCAQAENPSTVSMRQPPPSTLMSHVLMVQKSQLSRDFLSSFFSLPCCEMSAALVWSTPLSRSSMRLLCTEQRVREATGDERVVRWA